MFSRGGDKSCAERSICREKMRVVVGVLFIFASFIASSATAKVLSMAKPNCNETCGNVSIPYPFGMGDSRCFMNPWFQITCNHSISRPFLRKFNLEVLGILLDYSPMLLRVNNPVYSTCRDGSSWNSTDLSGTPFSYSDDNYLTVGGCQNNVVMKDERNEVLAGCTSICGGLSSPGTNGCYGINCCTNAIPHSLTFYTLTTSSVNTSACNYAFLASRRTNFTSNPFVMDHMQPVNLDWSINRSDYPELNDTDPTYYCSISNGNSDYNIRCQCYSYHEGNAYLENGCRVVEACAKCIGRCQQGLELEEFYCLPEFRSRKREFIIAGITFGGGATMLILFIFNIGMYKIIKRRRKLKLKKKFYKRNGGLWLHQKLSTNHDSLDTIRIFSIKELEKATDNFNISRVLGQGGQGTVYKAMLPDGQIVAVKKSRLVDEGQVEQFINEVVILSQINHRNIVKLLGCCLETEVPLLVYEFISNGTLSQLIHNQEDFPLSWEMRLRIATEVSGALTYLHSAISAPIYHRDIKSSNILLDDKYKAKVADFGTSRSVAIDQTHLTTIVQGTFGYLDPEFFRSSQFTDKSDVYSFGVVLVELLTGERPITSRGQEEKNLATLFLSSLEEDSLFDIIDERVAREGDKDGIMALVFLASSCLNMNGKQRPTMKEVMFEIERIKSCHMPSNVPENIQHAHSISKTNKKQEDNLSTYSFSNYTESPPSNSYPLLYDEESKKNIRLS